MPATSTSCFESSTSSPFCFAVEAATGKIVFALDAGGEKKKQITRDESHATICEQQEFREPLPLQSKQKEKEEGEGKKWS